MSKRKQEKEAKEVEAAAKIKFPIKWTVDEGLIHGDCETKPSTKVLAFDMVKVFKAYLTLKDDTLIRVKSGAKFAKDSNDWAIWNDKVVSVIKEHYDKGYKIVIMTNQGGIEKGHTTVDQVQKKIQNLIEYV